MCKWIRYILLICVPLLCLLTWYGCGKQEKSTSELIADLKSSQEKERVIAVRLLPGRKGDAVLTVPALIEALKDRENDIRWSAAIGLGNLGESAEVAVPALQATLKDHDGRVREAAGVALSRIDPSRFSPPTKKPVKGK
ncbi:MAG: HEAT repeat domain-containing protein [Gemmataceae bacterium]